MWGKEYTEEKRESIRRDEAGAAVAGLGKEGATGTARGDGGEKPERGAVYAVYVKYGVVVV